jgi:hypothetical protein
MSRAGEKLVSNARQMKDCSVVIDTVAVVIERRQRRDEEEGRKERGAGRMLHQKYTHVLITYVHRHTYIVPSIKLEMRKQEVHT